MHIGFVEAAVIILVAIALIKPENLKGYVKNFYRAMNTFKDARAEVQKEVDDLTASIKETKEDIAEAIK